MRKLRHRTLGLKLNTTALGWCLLEETGRLATDRQTGDPFALCLGAYPVDEPIILIGYSNDRSFAGSQAAADGLSRAEHDRMLQNLSDRLTTAGRMVDIKWMTADDDRS